MTEHPLSPAIEALRLLGPFPDNWVPERPGIDHDVVIVGGGHTGAAFAFALQRAGIRRFSIIDAAPDEAGSGIWRTRARMTLLRTPKTLVGPELGVPGLSFQAWYESRHGRQAYADLPRIPRLDWADYLSSWFRAALGLTIRYGTRLLRIEPADDHLRLHLDDHGRQRIETARKVILGNGVDGSGYAYLPAVLARLPDALRAHTADAIDLSALRGKSVAILGGAASAFDAAGAVLEAGAREVHLFARRDHIAATPVIRARGYPGAYDNYPHLPDAIRWQQAFRYRRSGSTPPPDSVERTVRFPNFHLHLATEWLDAQVEAGRIVARLPGGSIPFDFAIAGTGFRVDLTRRPELADLTGDILLWRDRYTPPADEADEDLGAHPYLDIGHALLERRTGTAPQLGNIHLYNPGDFVSLGLPIGDVPSLRRGVPAVTAAISRDLFFADLDHHAARFAATPPPEFDPAAYRAALRLDDRRAAE
ncbi:flavin-containing monooxygenase [Paracraurococcus lichenis]|uniref:NAD(P)/FAD-dependent oxidoreductase n=1 Tax=Paracraurococcus lichenis TaxID=3064888 RepID=A0ABT9E5W7_9PROT|nr:NAD(P)/FAD-dependent oxidoreductase [Paracraurococcus sp. LOR1-02]MDO9711492.1 NAD(P)/FAD-dependent oxidoreductase [Paracraurococcus sp. LOR1-02]